LKIIWAETGPEPRIASLDPRAPPLDNDGFRKPGQFQDNRTLDGRSGANHDRLFMVGRKAGRRDIEHIRSRRQGGKAQLTCLVRNCLRNAHENRRSHPAFGAWKNATALVPHRADQAPRQRLCENKPRKQEAHGEKHSSHRDHRLTCRLRGCHQRTA
jgi:hypothetical protein